MDKLAEIIAHKHIELESLIPRSAHLKAAALQRDDFRGFRSSLDRGPSQLGVIAEIKKASPSAGVIDPDFDPIKQAECYLDGGASCMSILTDEKYFQGSLSYLTKIAQKPTCHLLRKDFTIHELQIYEAIIAGADAILLIVAALDQEQLIKLYETARSLQLDVLVEVHDLPEMERALSLDGIDLLGINNRNLKTFKTDLATTEQLAEEAPDDILLISESGIRDVNDAHRVLEYGANAILVGETLMRSHIPAETIQEFLSLETEPVIKDGFEA